MLVLIKFGYFRDSYSMLYQYTGVAEKLCEVEYIYIYIYIYNILICQSKIYIFMGQLHLLGPKHRIHQVAVHTVPLEVVQHRFRWNLQQELNPSSQLPDIIQAIQVQNLPNYHNLMLSGTHQCSKCID